MPELADPKTRNPLVFPNGTAHPGTVFLSAAITHPRWSIGDYSYASSFAPPENWAAHLAPHLHEHAPEKLTLGRFCQIADGVRFITSSANHRMDGHSTYPFAIFSGFGDNRASLPGPEAVRDTLIGHDVWIGEGARILPGANIGSGVIIGAGAVVGGTIPDYAIVTGNPGKILRMRFPDETIARLLDIAWWHWSPKRIMAAEAAISGADIDALEQA